MTGKEALNLLFCTSEGLPEYKVYECKKILENELDELTKYKRAFEILGNHMFVPFGLFNERTGKINYYFGTNYSKHKLTKEEYELLEELFKGLEN